MRWRSWRGIAAAILAIAVLAGVALRESPIQAQEHETYVILFKQPAVPGDTEAVIARAGGALVIRYDAIGVAIAESDVDGFPNRLLGDGRVEGVATSSLFPLPLDPGSSSPQRDAETVAALALASGRASAEVASLDTGVTPGPGPLSSAVDAGASVSCTRGLPDARPAAWQDDNGHGTQVAAVVLAAAASLDPGGSAPARIAAIKVADRPGAPVPPEAIVCALVWAGAHHLDVVAAGDLTASLLVGCRDDPQQRTVFYAEQRALAYARDAGARVEIGGEDLPPGTAGGVGTPREQRCVAVPLRPVVRPPGGIS